MKENFQARLRSDGGPAGASGSGRRGGFTVQDPPPGQKRGVRHGPGRGGVLRSKCRRNPSPIGLDRAGGPHNGDVDSVGQGHLDNDLLGGGPVEDIGERQARMSGPGVADARRQVGDDGLRAGSHPCPHGPDRPGMGTGDDQVIDTLRGELGRLAGVGHRRLGQRHVGGLAEALLPQPAVTLPRLSPPVEELLGRAGLRQHLDEPVSRVGEGECHRPVTATGLVTSTGKTGANVAGHDERRPCAAPPPCAGRQHRSGPSRRRRRQQPTPVDPAPRGWLWRWSCRHGRATWWRTGWSRGRRHRGGWLTTRARAASTPIDVESSSNDATARLPRPPPWPSVAVIAARSSFQAGRYVP